MIFLAHDGTINCDWVSHYAIRIAAHTRERRLIVVHLPEGETSQEEIHHKLGAIEIECQHLRIAFDAILPQVSGTRAESICRTIPSGSESFLVCGTRAKERKRGWLSGTLSEQLLKIGHCQTLAIRVVHPGLLGMPRQILAPLAGHPRGLEEAIPFLRLFAPDMDQLHLLTINTIPHWRFRWLSPESARRRLAEGHIYLRSVERRLSEEQEFSHLKFDAHVVVSDDPAKEIVIATHRTKSRLIFAGASERSLSEQFFYGNPLEQLLRETPCDVAIYRGPK